MDAKQRAIKIIQQRNLCSYMNATKWAELRTAMENDMPFPPPFIVKYIFEDCCPQEKSFQNDVFYLGDWYEGLQYGNFFHGEFAIEWIKVRPRYLKSRGRLIAPELIDATEEFVAILNKCNISFEEENGLYCIYGYK